MNSQRKRTHLILEDGMGNDDGGCSSLSSDEANDGHDGPASFSDPSSFSEEETMEDKSGDDDDEGILDAVQDNVPASFMEEPSLPTTFPLNLTLGSFHGNSDGPELSTQLPESSEILDHADEPSARLTEVETAAYSLAEVVTLEHFRRRIARDYQRLLTTYTDEYGHSVYHSRIRAVCSTNGESLEVEYSHLLEAHAFLAKLVANVPAATLAIFDEATMRIVLQLFTDYDRIKPAMHVRIVGLPIADTLRDLRHNHLDTLVRVSGVVTRRSGVFPQLTLIKFDCGRCGAVLGPFVQDLSNELRINVCSECQARGPFTINAAHTVYRNYQKLTLQESPGTVPAGRLPRHKEVVLLHDLIDAARPGEHIEVTGIYRNTFSYALNSKNGFPVFATVIEANHVARQGEQTMDRLTEEEQREVRKLAEDPLIGLRIIRSIAPSIYGHADIKTAIALSLFGGQPKNVQGKHRLRGDINVLLLGDPGTAKSQFLKYVEKTAPRAIYTTGQGASAVGLTAAVRKDPITREWTLEGGALVLADKGICLIDEFDKMNDADRTSIHEAMEQQSISISKAGIVTSLQARCAIIAAANPVRGRYNAALPFSQNVQLTEPILSRFDVLCVVRDTVDPIGDERLARFVVGSHVRSHPLANGNEYGQSSLADDIQQAIQPVEPIPQDLLRKYILYSKSKVRPELSAMDVDKVSRLYAELRRESLASGSIPITVRHIESIVRLAEAHSRMHLRDHVREDDLDLAIRVQLESFIQSQKYAVMNHLKKAFSRYISYKKDHTELLYFILQELLRETLTFYAARYGFSSADQSQNPQMPKAVEINIGELEMRAKEVNIFDMRPFYASRLFVESGFRIDAAHHVIIKDL